MIFAARPDKTSLNTPSNISIALSEYDVLYPCFAS